ncbi:MAG: hypothetical protein NTV28_09170 [Propionibacteriales bacterium]|nr:hypothetical protein [Propionibacteriales bacterium]
MSRRRAVVVVLLVAGVVALAALALQHRVDGRRADATRAFAQVVPGLSEREVRAILGPPDPTVQDLAPPGGDCVVYVRADRTTDPFVALCFTDGRLRCLSTVGPPTGRERVRPPSPTRSPEPRPCGSPTSSGT